MSLALSAYVCVLCVPVLVLAYWHTCMGVYILSNCTDVFLNTWRLSCIFHSLSFIVVALSSLCAIHSNFLFSFCAMFIVCHFVPKVQYWAYLGTADMCLKFSLLLYSIHLCFLVLALIHIVPLNKSIFLPSLCADNTQLKLHTSALNSNFKVSSSKWLSKWWTADAKVHYLSF